MIILGITGPTGAGKSLFSDYLRELGVAVIDADQVYHGLLVPPSPCLDALRHAFGEGILREDGSLDRPALSELVFHDERKLALLNQTVLTIVLDHIRQLIDDQEANGVSLVAVDAPTLIESGFHKECTRVISVLSSEERRLERIIERDAISREAALARIRAQKPDAFYESHSDVILRNDTDKEQFLALCQTILPELGISPADQ